jgi:hypothetical protein
MNKRYNLLFFLLRVLSMALFMILVIPSCVGEKNESIDWDKAEPVKIKGLIKVYEDNVYIVENWTSKSCVSYLVFGPLKEEITLNEGKIALVTGKAIGDSPFSKNLFVESIIGME